MIGKALKGIYSKVQGKVSELAEEGKRYEMQQVQEKAAKTLVAAVDAQKELLKQEAGRDAVEKVMASISGEICETKKAK